MILISLLNRHLPDDGVNMQVIGIKQLGSIDISKFERIQKKA